MKKRLLTIFLCISPFALFAQPSASNQREEMKKLDWLLGHWQGAGWIQKAPQGRKEFTRTETIQSKLDGVLLLIEGESKAKESGSIVHAGVALVSYDEQGKTFRLRAVTSEGLHTDTEAKVGTNTLEWGLEIPERGRMRYTITLNDKGEWFQVGEMTQDGQTWHKFVEITLHRQGRAVGQESQSDPRRQIIEAFNKKDVQTVCNLAKAHPELYDAKGSDGITPLHVVASLDQKDTARLLLAKGADVNAKSSDGDTPLHIAAITNNKDVAALLLAKGAGIDAKDAHGRTSLYDAVAGGSQEVVELLLTKGADTNVKTDDGITPLSVAIANHHDAIATLLRAKGAKE